jgi:hypothetical protein
VTVCIIDTSIFCEMLAVPNMTSNKSAVQHALKVKINAREALMLPVTAILETGNHIGQNGDGGARRKAAGRFVEQVRAAIEGRAPFTATAFLDRPKLLDWLTEFAEWAGRVDAKGKGSGLGDLTIYREWLEMCDKFPGRRVYVWSTDAQLLGFDRIP